eukprot:gene10712-biopygen2550
MVSIGTFCFFCRDTVFRDVPGAEPMGVPHLGKEHGFANPLEIPHDPLKSPRGTLVGGVPSSSGGQADHPRPVRRLEDEARRGAAVRGARGQAPATLGRPWETPWENLGIAWRCRAPETSATLGKPWNGFWGHLGRGQAAGRPGADKGKHKGNTMVGTALAKPWHRLWETLEDVGKRWGTLEPPWKPFGRPWKTLESTGC